MERAVKYLFCGFALWLGAAFSADARDFRVAFVGDPQVDDSLELDFARRSIYRELREARDIDFAVIMGDLVNENPSLLGPSKASLDSLPYPCLCIPGNHDCGNVFNEVFGYGDTTFVVRPCGGKWRSEADTAGDSAGGRARKCKRAANAGVRFILMNNIISGFGAGFSEAQLAWLRGVMEVCGPEQRVVFAVHVPLRYCKGGDEVLSILADHPKTLMVSAHLHRVFRAEHSLSRAGNPARDAAKLSAASGNAETDVRIEEIGVGATCGSWWRGVGEPVLVEKGDTLLCRGLVPNARMNCGAPRGYFITVFKRDGSYSSRYKRVGRDVSDQASVTLVGDSLYVNVYGGHIEGSVEVGFGGGKRVKCRRTGTVAPEVQEIITYNDSFSRSEKRARKRDFIPMRRLSSPHLWVCAPPEGFDGGKVSIRYADPTMRFCHRSVDLVAR